MRWLLAAAVLAALTGCGSDTKVGEDVGVGKSGGQGGAIRATATPAPTPLPKGQTPAPAGTPKPTPKPTPPPAQNIAAEFAITAEGFKDNSISVFAGSVIRATNKDKDPRGLKADGGEFESGLLQTGQSWTYKVDLAPGQYRFTDTTRPYVLGFLQVSARP